MLCAAWCSYCWFWLNLWRNALWKMQISTWGHYLGARKVSFHLWYIVLVGEQLQSNICVMCGNLERDRVIEMVSELSWLILSGILLRFYIHILVFHSLIHQGRLWELHFRMWQIQIYYLLFFSLIQRCICFFLWISFMMIQICTIWSLLVLLKDTFLPILL